MTIATGAFHGLALVPEVVFGTTPVSPDMIAIRHTGCSLLLSKDSFQSQELRADRQITDFRQGANKIGGDVSIELSYGEYDDMLEAVFAGTWGAAYNLTAQTMTVTASAKTFARSAGSFIADGVKVGDYITTTGFTDGGNNGTFLVSAVAELVVTCATAAGLADVTDDTPVVMTTSTEKLTAGTTFRSFTFEREFADITEYGVFTGCALNTLALSVKPNEMVTGSFGVVGKGASYSATPLDADNTPSQTNPPFDAYTGTLDEGGAVIAVVSSLDLSLDNGLDPLYVVGSADLTAISMGRSNVTGSIGVYFEDLVMLNKFINETESSLEFDFGTPSDGAAYTLNLPRIVYSGADNPVSGEEAIVLNMPFQALYDTTEGTNIVLRKFPGA